jgi:hypothetical protein
MATRGESLLNRLYIPEPFSVDERDAINDRRLAHWQTALPVQGQPQKLMLLIGEVKEISPTRYGFKGPSSFRVERDTHNDQVADLGGRKR